MKKKIPPLNKKVFKILLFFFLKETCATIETPTRFWSWFIEGNFDSSSFSVVASGNFGQVKKAKFKSEQELKKNNTSLSLYAEQIAALKYPLGEKHDWNEQFHSLSHEVSCTLILHPNIGKKNLKLKS